MSDPTLVKSMSALKVEMLQVAYDMTFSNEESVREHSVELLNMAKNLDRWIEHLIHKEIT